MENKKQKNFYSLKTKITLNIVVFVLVILTVVFSFSFMNARNISRNDLKNRLLNMVGIAALQVNGDDQAFLQKREDENTPIYRNSIQTLKNIQNKSTDIYYIYTMKENTDGDIVFVLDPDDADPNNISHIGDVYKEPSKFLKDNFMTMDKPVVESNLYTDEWGTWLSGYAPFFDKNGNRTGVLGIDINATEIIKRETSILYVYLITFIISGLLSVILGFYISKKITRSLVNLTNILKNSENSDLKIENISNDEVGELTKVIKNTLEEVNISQKDKDTDILEKNKTLEKINKLMVGRELEMIKLKKEIEDLKRSDDKNK